MQKTLTLVDVAKAAKVSKTTVSNVFSSPERVRPQLRERVEAAARALGYDGPDPKGRLLSSGRVNAIGVVPIGNFGVSLFLKNSYFRALFTGVAEVCEEHGAGVSLVSARDDQELWGIRNAIVDGFIFNSLEQANLIERATHRRLPFVITGPDGGTNASSVSYEDRQGAIAATRHLLALGHRRFAIGSTLADFRPPVHHPAGEAKRQLVSAAGSIRNRLEGVAEALAEAGISIDSVPIVEACGTADEAVAFGNGAAMLLDNASEATAIVALADSLALNILDQAKRRGISVPRDLSITGFDDIPEAALADPPLTTIALPALECGRTAARLLLTGGPLQHVVLPAGLVIRASAAAPRR